MYAAAITVFYHAVKSMMSSLVEINDHSLRISDLREFFKYELKEPAEKMKDDLRPSSFTIEFVNVSFKYDGMDKDVLKHFSLKIEHGQRVAIVGVNGAGKTTLIKLLCRLYEPYEGEILLNGKNINTIPKQQYLSYISTVFQEVVLFAFSIAENISLKESDQCDIKQVMQSLQKVGLLEKVNSLERGVHTNLYKFLDDEGIQLSGGEEQRLSLARALYKDSSIMILDEPTSSLDPIAEYELYKSFNDMLHDNTAVYISHRLSSTRFCDVIAFLEEGSIVEYGTHEQLMGFNGKYARMFNVQSQYYQG